MVISPQSVASATLIQSTGSSEVRGHHRKPSRTLEDTSKPEEIFKVLKTPKSLEHQVLLIVGGVGVGKSTFIDHLQYAALPKDLIDTTVWLRVNMNNAPASANEIYSWLRLEIIHGCRAAYPDLDFDTLETIKAVFSVEVRRLEKGIGKLYQANQQLHDEKLADYLQELMKELHQQAVAYTRYCSTERGKLLVIVVDNCLSDHPKAANRDHLKTGQLRDRDVDNDKGVCTLRRHEQRLERRKETTSDRAGAAGLALTTH